MGITKSLFMELSCEEEFELNAWCDERREADIAAQDAAMVEAEDERCWCKFFESCPTCFGAA